VRWRTTATQAPLLQKHRWIVYIGLAIILYVAGDIVVRGVKEVWPYASAQLAWLL
jgi:predicted tellurium resistance membrane protein TerC